MKTFTVLHMVVILIILFGFTGWCMNAAKLADCDFEAPYKAEVVRTIGIFIVPAGAVTGWMDLGR